MADISDVEQAIADTVTSILYPGGSSQSSIIGVLCRIYRGWPNSATLNADLSSGLVNVTVAADNDSGRTTTRYLSDWDTAVSQPGASASATGQLITISGAPTIGDIVGVMVDDQAYACRIRPGDSAELVAANLGQLMQSKYIVNVTKSTITIPGARSIRVRVVCDQASSYESRRQEKDVRIIFWCPNPASRDMAVSAVDAALNVLNFLGLPYDTKARIVYRNTSSYDQAQNALLYRRDLVYTIEYPTVTTVQQPSMLYGVSDINGSIIYG